MSEINQDIIWNIIDKYFMTNTYSLVEHNLESYNLFFKNELKQIFINKNPIKILKKQDSDGNFNYQCFLYLGGKDGSKIYYGKPIIYDDTYEHYMYPNEARLRNMTYGMTIHYDVDVEFKIIKSNGDSLEESITLDKIYLGKFPIMLHSNYCLLKGLPKTVRFNMGECKNDKGGYFIIDGKEKSIISQEKFSDNQLYIREMKDNLIDNAYSISVEVKSRSEDADKPVRTTYVRLVAPSPTLTNNQIVVLIPNVKAPVPLFIVMRALGILSDKKIIEYCLLDREKYKDYEEIFRPSIHDSHNIFTQHTAMQFIKELTKEKTINKVQDILINYFIPHIGENDFNLKALYLGYMVFKLIRIKHKHDNPTDRDNFIYKRVDLPGILINNLFTEYYTIQQQSIFKKIDREYYYHDTQYQDEQFINLIQNNFKHFFSERDVELGFKRAFKGNWGAQAHTKKIGVIQDLNRLSFNSFLSQLRKLNLSLDASAKVVGPRYLHGSQIGYIDPVDTPDGGNVGLHKHLAIMTKISIGESKFHIIKWLRDNKLMKLIHECSIPYLSNFIKIFVNGAWIGITQDPKTLIYEFKYHRRLNIINYQNSISWFIKEKTIQIYTDGGRLLRPIFYIENNQLSLTKSLQERILSNSFSWQELVFGSNTYPPYTFLKTKKPEELGIIDYIDVSEEANAFICYNPPIETYTHCEIHPSLMLGVMGNQIVFPANNQLPRDLFFCGQGKQAVSLYNSNFPVRIDKMGVVLNYGQTPLVKSKFLKHINNEEHPYGENVIVAIGVYSSYNVEDSIIFNKGSLDRGMFRTTYFNSYETKEESSSVKGSVIDSKFTNIEHESNVLQIKPGYDYSYLDKYGFIKENTPLHDKIILIGKTISSEEDPTVLIDDSVATKKGQLGIVDKTFVTDGEEGFRIGKVRIREERVPAIGDKFCSRCGQKGTVGIILPEEDMPFNEHGLRPDIIVNPHAFPSRMTIGQLVETILSTIGCQLGYFGDCTAFINKGSKHTILGNILTKQGFNSSGNQILYNGITGEQIECTYYIGPTYYMRLKHMVKDKINYRSKGPRTALTRQTVQGRANDGGLRIGEMEKDALVSHGISYFLNESMLVRGDDYHIAICNNSGTLAIYNQSKNIFLSPMIDGPIKFVNQNLPYDPGKLHNISRFGKDFSIIRIPYTFKLLLQELSSMNVCMRLITDDNIDLTTSMSYNHTIDLEQLKLPKKLPTLNIKTFNIGDQVTYKNDSNSSRNWVITNIKENDITISTDNLDNLPSYVVNNTITTNSNTLLLKPKPPTDESASPPLATDQAASPQLATDQAASPQLATDQSASPQLATDLSESPPLAADQGASPQLATDQAASPQLATDQAASPQLATDQAASPQLATDQAASTQPSAKITTIQPDKTTTININVQPLPLSKEQPSNVVESNTENPKTIYSIDKEYTPDNIAQGIKTTIEKTNEFFTPIEKKITILNETDDKKNDTNSSIKKII